ncbi:ribosomal protein S5 domain 2-type protein [Suillus bovinus]|uniref:ribosomal protein S5 domain 2-type protein n=1 Tax=Suillus bovinus TaxID=48563 RepID=UPI001B8817A0|nr:ribosomal protein S5 domain 2-type protein [Suillus bovinus]KAG2158010.1 ribosomal protein S5 domain 2-type protein [Suillus bovinus]
MRPPSPSIPEKKFVYDALKQSLRLDGRDMLDFRTPTFTFGPELGWVECAMGKTRVIAQLDAKMVKPLPERPFEGIITIHSEISPMASSDYEPGRSSEEEVTLTRMLDKVLRRSDAIDKESLCVLAGQRVWQLRLTVHVLADAGNILDCSCLAGIVALKHFRKPEVEVIGDEVIVVRIETALITHHLNAHPISLAIHHTPFCLTFAFFPDALTRPVVDPSLLEQRLSSGLMSIAMNAQREICVLHKAGGVPTAPEEVLRLINVTSILVKDLDKRVEARLLEDWEGRKIEVT